MYQRKYKYPYYPRKHRQKNAAFSQRQKLWQGMRILRHFDVEQLAAVAAAEKSTARNVIAMLKKFGVVCSIGPQQCPQQYRLMMDLGPHAPSFRADGTLYDHNTKHILEKQRNRA